MSEQQRNVLRHEIGMSATEADGVLKHLEGRWPPTEADFVATGFTVAFAKSAVDYLRKCAEQSEMV